MLVSVNISSNGKGIADAVTTLLGSFVGKVEAGWFPETQPYAEDADGEVRDDVGFEDNVKFVPVAAVAHKQEYGDESAMIPARPFMRPAAINNGQKWVAILRRGVEKGIPAEDTFDLIGVEMKSNIQEAIEAVRFPRLAKSTIELRAKRRGYDMDKLEELKKDKTNWASFTKPLIDTGHMHDSVEYRVNGKQLNAVDEDVPF